MADRLEALHDRIADLTDPGGAYAVVCPRSGKRPVPVRGASFPTPEAAATAVDLVVEYRSLLREVDPHLENVPIVACRGANAPLSLSVDDGADERDRDSGGDDADGREREWGRGRKRGSERADDRANDRDHGRTGNRRTGPRDRGRTVTLSGDGDDEWLRVTDAPVVRVRAGGDPIDDAVIGLALNATL